MSVIPFNVTNTNSNHLLHSTSSHIVTVKNRCQVEVPVKDNHSRINTPEIAVQKRRSFSVA